MATIKYWDGSAWQYAVVGKQGPVGPTGPTGPAGQASLQRFRYVATGGQTSVSGTDANGNTLAYTPGLEEVFINGAAQVRGQDYTATNGSSITGLTALIASDVVEILAWGTFNVSNTISNTLVDAKGDILAGTGADSVGRLAVGGNGTVLTANSATATGLEWGSIAAGSLTLLSTTTLSGTSTTISSISQDYQHLFWVLFEITASATPDKIRVTPNNNNQGYVIATRFNASSGTTANTGVFGALEITSNADLLSSDGWGVWSGSFYNYTATTYRKSFDFRGGFQNTASQVNSVIGGGIWNSESAITSIAITNSAGATFTAGTFLLYGVK